MKIDAHARKLHHYAIAQGNSKPFSNMMMQWGSTPEHFGDGGKIQLPFARHIHIAFMNKCTKLMLLHLRLATGTESAASD